MFGRQSSQLVSDLTVQNQRLTSQLRSRGANEKELRNEINQMKQQFSIRKTSIQEHFLQVDTLRKEISSVMSEKTELENQIRFLLQEKADLAKTLALIFTANFLRLPLHFLSVQLAILSLRSFHFQSFRLGLGTKTKFKEPINLRIVFICCFFAQCYCSKCQCTVRTPL